jgi:hypothetical protein
VQAVDECDVHDVDSWVVENRVVVLSDNRDVMAMCHVAGGSRASTGNGNRAAEARGVQRRNNRVVGDSRSPEDSPTQDRGVLRHCDRTRERIDLSTGRDDPMFGIDGDQGKHLVGKVGGKDGGDAARVVRRDHLGDIEPDEVLPG